MATTQLTGKPSLRKAGRVFGLRLENEILEQLKTKASRRGVTVAEYCRSILLADVRKSIPKTTTAAEIYQVAFKTLEDVQLLKNTTLDAVILLLKEYADAETVLPPDAEELARAAEERKTNPNAKPPEGRKARRFDAVANLFATQLNNRTNSALARLREA